MSIVTVETKKVAVPSVEYRDEHTYVLRLTQQQALDIRNLFGSIGGQAPARTQSFDKVEIALKAALRDPTPDYSRLKGLNGYWN